MSGKNPCCFVCDIAVSNRYFSLANCRTQLTKKKLVEKLGQLVGEKYMVVITEDDVICRSCANLMNTLDRLEVEMGSVRRVVLKFLERKYALQEGELLNQPTNNTLPSEPEKQPSSTFLMRKKAADEEMDNDTDGNPGDPRSKIWMQCDKCQYTTNYTSFVNNHIRNELCLNCEAPLQNGLCSQDCEKEKSDVAASPQATKSKPEAMELMTNNMSVLNGSNEESLPMFPEESSNQDKLEVTLNVNESGELSLNDAKADDKGDKPALYLQVVDEEDEDDFENSNVRQVLAVTGDGAVEMLEVMWNEETNSPVAEIPF